MKPVGEMHLLGRLTAASNATFLARDEEEVRWLYKPLRGETPLNDFPQHTLGRREVAAYAVSQALGLDLVPETLWGSGPLGEGSLQRWIDEENHDLVTLLELEKLETGWLPIALAEDSSGKPLVMAHRDDARLRTLALFDLIVNNADRKASHIVLSQDHVYGVDHGLVLHQESKLRTVLWGFAGDEFTAKEQETLQAAASLSLPLSPGLTEAEWESLSRRADDLLQEGIFPLSKGGWRDLPWPPL